MNGQSMAWQVRKVVKKMKRTRAATATALALCAAMAASPLTSMAAGPLAKKVNSGYDEETWTRLQDNVLEYDEISNLVHEYNSTIQQSIKDMEKMRQEFLQNAEDLESHSRKMENLKDTAKEEGDYEAYGNYYAQEMRLSVTARAMESTGLNLLSKKAVAGMQQGEDAITKAVQSLMISYDSLSKQRGTLVKLQELYDRQYQMMVNRRTLGLVTDTDVLRAQTNQLSALSNIQTVDGVLLQMKPRLCTLTGWAADADPMIAPIPSVDMSRIASMNLEEDTWKAIGNNQTLIEQRHSAQGKTNDGTSARMAYIEEGDQKLTIRMKQLYDDVAAKITAREGALSGYQSAQQSAAGYEHMYGLGLISEADYLGSQIAYYQKQAEYENADTDLLLAVETYWWAVKGFAELD